ncbi:enterocin L50 family leaderless bacteriocin [Priestia megaterium]|nr:enterocin L50 family leaderless bacteriocin [Priestia megaterium]
MITAAKIAAQVGWALVKKWYSRVMQMIGEGWTINQITNWLKDHK